MTTKPRYVVPGTLRTPSTSSTVALYATIRATLLAYTSPQGERLTDLIGDPPRLFVRAQPEPVVFPYLTLLLSRTSLAEYNGYRETLSLEVQAMGRPDIQLPTIESAMDIVDQCLTGFTYASDGLMVSRARTRQTIPQFTSPAEQTVVGVIATYTMYAWPALLTSTRAL
jgi:hypothetical protein